MGVHTFSLHTLLAFFSTRVLRGGPKILVYLATCLFASVLGTRFLSQTLSEAAVGTTKAVWHWSTGESWNATRARIEEENAVGYGSNGRGNLRVVVFGEKDVATPTQTGEKGLGWTDVLCQELHCSTYMSFIPGHDRSLESHSFYAEALERVNNLTANRAGPGEDYTLQAEHFPGAWREPDLRKQVTAFLNTDKPAVPPRETVYVFTFGSWDVWSLATLPLDISRPAIDKMTQDIFDQAERLYQSSLDEDSIAWSDIHVTLSAKGHSSKRKTDMFRILVPRVFDPSLTPAWQTARPELASVHSQAEQMRNAFVLTGEWNVQLHNKMDTWVRGPDETETSSRSSSAPDEETPDAEYFLDVVARLQAEVDAAAAERKGSRTTKRKRQVGPLRDGFLYDLPEYLLDAIAERQLRNAGLKDGAGFGAKEVSEDYLDVATPCADRMDSSVLCEAAGGHLFSTPFTVASRAIGETGSLAAEMVRGNHTMRARWESFRVPASMQW